MERVPFGARDISAVTSVNGQRGDVIIDPPPPSTRVGGIRFAQATTGIFTVTHNQDLEPGSYIVVINPYDPFGSTPATRFVSFAITDITNNSFRVRCINGEGNLITSGVISFGWAIIPIKAP